MRRALGASRGDICGQFLTESMLLSLLGGAAGTAVGLLSSLTYSMMHSWPFVVRVPSLAVGSAGAAIVGVLAGLHPAVRASRLSPTEALAAT